MQTLRGLVLLGSLLAASVPARASAGIWEDFWGWVNMKAAAHRNDMNKGSRGAPEPVTLLGLGLGAGTLAVAAWRKRRQG